MSISLIKPKKKMVNVFLIFLVLLSSACQKENPEKNTNFSNPFSDPPQYGIPYTGVPDPRDAVIYQVNIRSFSPSRNFQGVIARLDSISGLGVNVIYLMPIHPVGSLMAFNSPYCVKDYKAINTEFGTLDDLRKLIEEAHKRDMAVILDWVANHTSWDHAWMSNPSWYARDDSGNIIIPNNWNDVAQLNFDNADMREEMIKAMKYWVLVSNCDGFRFDYSDGPPSDFWTQAIDTLRKMSSHKLLLLAEGTRSDSYASGFNYTFGFRFYDRLKDIFLQNRPVTILNNVNESEYVGAGELDRVVRYTTNHDVNSSDGTPLDLFGGKAGSMAAFIVAAYMKGVPMIYNGQEVGNSFPLTFPFTGPTIDWSKNQDMVEEYKKVIAFRNQSEAIRRGTLNAFSSSDVCAFTKTSANETVLVFTNLRNANIEFEVPTELTHSQWIDAFSGNPVSISTLINLPPFAYMVLKN